MSASTVRVAFVIGLIHAFAAAAIAQDDDKRSEPVRTPYYSSIGSTLTFLLTKPGVQKELGLGELESKALMESLREIDPNDIAFRTPEELQRNREMREETARECDAAIQKSLSKDQFRRYQQLAVQQVGGRALLRPETAQQLALTAEQREKLETIKNESGSANQTATTGLAAGTGRPNDEEARVRLEKFNNDLLAVLMPDQANQWKEMTGAPFKIPNSFGASWQLLLLPEVQKELGLSEDEAASLGRSLTAIRREGFRQRVGSTIAGRNEADQRRRWDQIIDAVSASLSVSQWNRLQELILQDRGVDAFQHHEVANKLGLSREQQDRVREAIREYHRGITEDRTLQVRPKDRKDKKDAALLDILTADQKKQWDAMQGVKVNMILLIRPSSAPAGK